MKKAMIRLSYLLWIAVLGIAVSCGGGQIKVKKDSFTGENVATMMLRHPVEGEKGYSGAKIIYSKNVGNSNAVTLAVLITAKETASLIKGDALVKAGEKMFTIAVQDPTENVKEDYYGTVTGDDDTAHVNVYKTSQKLIAFKLVMKGDIQDAIMKSDPVYIRVSSGSTPLNIVLEKEKLGKVREFVQMK